MRKLILKILGTAASFYVASYFLAGLHLDATWSAYLIASIVFVIFNALLTPIIKLRLLPINLLTLGLFRWLTNVLTLYLFDLAYDGIRITSFDYGAISSVFLSLPAGHLSLFWTLVLASLLMSLTYSIIGVLFQADN